MERLQRLFGAAAAGQSLQPGVDTPTVDNAEMVYISSLALLKMLKHGRAGVPMEVMGLMLGEFVDDYTVRVIDVFAMPQSGTGVSVEAVDPVFQTKMLEMLKQTGRPEMVVGWYHSHPGFGCWLSSVDINTQQSFEALNQRAVAVVVDPIQSVKGKVVIDAFRLINPQMLMLGQEPRQTTSNIGHLNKPSIQALIHGLNRHYYSIAINYRKNELEQKMLLNLHKKNWTHGLTLHNFTEHTELNEKSVKAMLTLAEAYNKSVQEESTMTTEQLKTRHVGKQDPKRHLEESLEEVMSNNIVMALGAGAGGTSAAYFLSEKFENTSLKIESTIFERSNYVGGRSTVVKFVRDEQEYPIELGASIFIDVNYHLANSAKKFGLEYEYFGKKFPGARLGIWDGKEFVFEQTSYKYWDIVKIFWKYGWAPYTVQNMVKDIVSKFLAIYKFQEPFTSVQSASERLDLAAEIQHTALNYFRTLKKIDPLYLSHFVEAASRVNYVSNLDQIHALGGFISLAPEGAKSIKGGNYLLFENWIKHSGATLKLETTVTKVTKLDSNHEKDGDDTPKYEITTQNGKKQIFDAVILAAPIQFAQIDFENININVKEIPYVTLHVTLITGHLNPAYFNRENIDDLPSMILTVNSELCDFNSLGCQYKLENGERVCKIFSHHEMTDELLDKIFLSRSWTYYKIWKSYPWLSPNQTYPPIELDQNLFYVNSFEPFISTMETEAVSSENIAKILKRRWVGPAIKSKL
ncbi:11248_t:CDS:10 [Ambispora leptoticha]|uniref:11248_t:CDS:1 n=1 Tax=Ambispora leptoticha TaxID=144679 RepID=A0A9N8VD85_9GLOM|nr:11248_t:CDS:10 [Ambispora leptoticha]